MSVRETCQNYYSATNWKHALFDIANALKGENHPDYEKFSEVAITLVMMDKPGCSYWLDWSIKKLAEDPKALLNPVKDLGDYEEMSARDLVEKYEAKDPDYPENEVLRELKYRFGNLIRDDQYLSDEELKERLRDVL